MQDAQHSQPPRKKSISGFVIAPLVIFFALAAMFAFALTSGDPSKLPSVLIGKPAPEFSFRPLAELQTDGKPVPGFSNEEFKSGKPSVVNFWASWCVPCIQEHPLLIELQKQTGVDIYGVNYKDDPAAARRFIGRYGNPYAAVGTDPTGRGAIEWGVYGMPETFVLNGNGEIVYKHVGPISAESLKAKVVPAVEKAREGSAQASAN